MKSCIATAVQTICLLALSSTAANYSIVVNGTSHDIDIGKEISVNLANGTPLTITLNKKAIVTFSTDNFSFDYSGDGAPSRSDIGDGIFQTMMSSPLGTLVLLQEYGTTDPSSLIDLMIKELTKEEKKYGYTITETPSQMKIGSGILFKGKKSVVKYKGEETTRQVLVHSVKDGGVMVITSIGSDASEADKKMIDIFWKSLKISMK